MVLFNRWMSGMSVHPATCLMLWFFFVGIAHCLRGVAMAFLFILFPLLGRHSLKRGWGLIARARWLLLPVFLFPAWMSPGRLLWESGYAPTYEGLDIALTHLGRLLLVLMSVGVLLEKLPMTSVLSASRTLLRPMDYFGTDIVQRGLVRLLLALRYAEEVSCPRGWRNLLETPASVGEEWVELQELSLRWMDYLLIFSGALLFVMVFYSS